jgi:hypothetical protein
MNILYYNRQLIFHPKQIELLRKHNIIKENITDEYINLFKEANFCANPTASLIDRTGGFDFFIPMTVSKIPQEKDKNNKSFKQLCEERATEMLNRGKRINIQWSGGIDSTTVLWSLINKANDMSQLRVICTPDSIAESGNMFDLHIKNKIPFIMETKVGKKCYFYPDVFDTFETDREIITSGCLSDDLNSIIRLKLPFDKKYHDLQYEEALLQFTSQKVIDFLNKSVKKFPKKIKCYVDFLRYYGFNFHWHKEKYHNQIGQDPKYFSCFESFFDTDDFQKWAIWSDEADVREDINDGQGRKKPQRDLIYELSGDKLYSYDKIKGMNGPGIHYNNDWFFLMENGHTFSLHELYNKKKIYFSN